MVYWSMWIIHLMSFFSKGKVSISLNFNYSESHAKGVFDPRGWASKLPLGHLENRQIEEKPQHLWGTVGTSSLLYSLGNCLQSPGISGSDDLTQHQTSCLMNSKGAAVILCLYQGPSARVPLALADRQSSVVGAEPVHCGVVSSTPGPYPLDAGSTPSCDNQQCLQTLANVPWGKIVFRCEPPVLILF